MLDTQRIQRDNGAPQILEMHFSNTIILTRLKRVIFWLQLESLEINSCKLKSFSSVLNGKFSVNLYFSWKLKRRREKKQPDFPR